MTDKFDIFEVGHRYENRRGAYEVIEITPPQIRIRYDSGEVINADLATQVRIIENMRYAAAPTHSTVRVSDPSSRSARPQRRNAQSGMIASTPHNQSVSSPTSACPTAFEFAHGHVYRRRDIHRRYRGQEQGGICTPRDFPIILLFTGQSGDPYGYRDYWDDDDIFHYYGEGQLGDMEFIRGNKAIRDHVESGKDLHLFETIGNGEVRYINQMTYVGYDYVPNVPDAAEKTRTAIVFKLMARRGA